MIQIKKMQFIPIFFSQKFEDQTIFGKETKRGEEGCPRKRVGGRGKGVKESH